MAHRSAPNVGGMSKKTKIRLIYEHATPEDGEKKKRKSHTHLREEPSPTKAQTSVTGPPTKLLTTAKATIPAVKATREGFDVPSRLL